MIRNIVTTLSIVTGATAHEWRNGAPSSLYELFAIQANATSAQVNYANNYPTQGACQGCKLWDLSPAFNNWVVAFYPGILWKLANHSIAQGDNSAAAFWLAQGNAYNTYLASNVHNNGTHDVGFMTIPAFLPQYELTPGKNQTAADLLVTTAHTLAERFSPIVGCFESWGRIAPANHQFEVIVDNMINLELPFWVAAQTGNTTLYDMAVSHSDRMITDIFQPKQPGCVWHLVTYNDQTGTILNRSSTPQGLGLDTVWSRGQGWATYGFAMAHRYTQNPKYLQTAASAADCFIRLVTACCSDNYAPFWDFYAGPPLAPSTKMSQRDTSAAMIASSGMIELAWNSAPADRARYLAFVQTTLDAVTTAYLSSPGQSNAVLNNGTTSYPQWGVPIIYGDYYLLEAAMRWDATPQEWRDEAAAYLAANGRKW